MSLRDEDLKKSPDRKRPLSDDDDEEELDDEDYELIQQNTGVNLQNKKQFRRLKQKDADSGIAPAPAARALENIFDDVDLPAQESQSRVSYDARAEADLLDDSDDDLDDFIVDDDGEAGVSRVAKSSSERRQRKQTRAKDFRLAEEFGFSQDAWVEVHDLFGDGTDYEYALGKGGNLNVDDGMDYEQNVRLPEEKKIEDIYEPAELVEKMFTERDEKIRQDDVPERFQSRPWAIPQEDELVREAEWIAQRMLYNKSATQPKQLRQIEQILKFIRVDMLEVIFILRHRRDYFSDSFADDDIWEIFDLDDSWNHINQKKSAMLKWKDVVFDLDKLLDGVTDEDSLKDVSDYLQLRHARVIAAHGNQEADATPNGQEKRKYKRPVKKDLYQLAQEANLDNMAARFVISAEQFGDNMHTGYKRHVIDDPPKSCKDIAEEFKCSQFPSSMSVCQAVEMMISRDLTADPRVRAETRQFIRSIAHVSVSPTEKGKLEIDESHPYSSFNYLMKKPVRKFDDEQFLHILKGEQNGLLTLEIGFDDFKLDEKIHSLYLSDNVDRLGEEWNEVRRRILKSAFQSSLVPATLKWLSDALAADATRYILKRSIANFESKLLVGPFVPNIQEFDIYTGFRVMAFSCGGGENTASSFGCLVNENGEVVDYIKLGQIHSKNRDIKSVELVKLKEFLEKLHDRRNKELPIFAVSGWSSANYMFYQDLHQLLTEVFGPEAQLVWARDEVARLYMNSEKSRLDFPQYPPILKYCISIARFLQEPLHEYAGLFDKDRSILFLRHYQSQDLIPKDKLYTALERKFCAVVNEVGVDINKSLTVANGTSLFPFVCGLGARKAGGLVSKIKSRGGIVETRNDFVRELGMGKVIFMNCASFFRIDQRGLRGNRRLVIDVLDSTRIHPEDYMLARKMAADALDIEDMIDEENPSAHVEDIMEQPERLDELDLADFAKELQKQKGQPKKITLEQIKKELNDPYLDARSPFYPPGADELFTMLTAESEKTLKMGMIVAVVVTRVKDKFVMTRLDSGLDGIIGIANLGESARITDCSQVVKIGQSLRCQVLGIQKDRFLVDLAVRPVGASLNTGLTALPKDPYYDMNAAQVANNRHAGAVDSRMQTQIRSIQHPLFDNINYKQAESKLANQPPGSMVFRPSSQGLTSLSVSWKIAEGLYQHVEVKEEETGGRAGKVYRIENDVYGDLDEISVRFVSQLYALCRQVMTCPKFKGGSRDDLHSFVDREMQANPKKVPYVFGHAPRIPGKFLLVYKLHATSPVAQDIITAIPSGLRFRGVVYPDINTLLQAFKSNPHRQAAPNSSANQQPAYDRL
eukprot:Partr_v1_DN29013_c0_g1_i1_m58653 putative Transcription elongation factor